MRTAASELSARVVRLGSPEADDRRMGGTPAQRVAAVGELTRLAWSLARLPWPRYTRETMPARRIALADDGGSLARL